MSNVVYVNTLITEAAFEIGDSNRTRIDTEWMTIYNKSQREACEKFTILEREYVQGLETTDRYAFPDGMTKLRTIRSSYSPTDPNTFYDLREMTDDEFRDATRRRYSIMQAPSHYFPRRDMFHVWPQPAGALDNALICVCYSLPDPIATIAGTLMEVPDVCQSLITERMVIEGLKALDRYEAARDRYEAWLRQGAETEDEIEDRTLDRRQSIQPRSSRHPLAGMA